MALSDDTFGAVMIGLWIAMLMYGITTLQTYSYYNHYPNDKPSIKFLVAVVWLLDTFHVALVCHALYYYLIQNFGNPKALAEANWSLITSVTVNITIAFVVQVFFTQRIYALCRKKKWLITGVIGFTVVAHFAFGLETVGFIYKIKVFNRLQEMKFIAALPFAIFVVLSDVFISAALCVFLHSSKTGYEDTNSMINRLIVYSINRCVLICVVAIIEVVVFIVKPHSLYVFAFDFIIGKLYANCLMASLNSRKSLRTNRGHENTLELSTSFNLATMPNSTVRTETTADVRAEQILSLNSNGSSSAEKDTKGHMTTSDYGDNIITNRRSAGTVPGKTGEYPV